MRVGIDVSPVTPRRTGVGYYCFHLVKHLLELGPDCEFKGFFSGIQPIAKESLDSRLVIRRFPLPTRLLYASWRAFNAPKVDTLLGGVDLYHATNYFLPPVSKAKRIVTIHDLAFIVHPEWCSPKITDTFRRNIRRFAHEADAVLATSEHTKADIITHLEVPAEKITVTLEGADSSFTPLNRSQARAHIEKTYDIREPYLLFVGTFEPRKNIEVLLRAFAQLVPDVPHKLVLVGEVGWNAATIFKTLRDLKLEDRVVRLGYVANADLPALYSGADAFVFPTRYEGFGIPLLEAMACGCPVVASNVSSVPEVVGDAGLLIDPDDVDGLYAAVLRVLEDESERSRLIERGLRQSRKFSWQSCALKTLEAYHSVLGQG